MRAEALHIGELGTRGGVILGRAERHLLVRSRCFAFAALACLSGCGSETSCPSGGYAANLPEGVVVYANSECTVKDPDGSRDRPFQTVADAAAYAAERGLETVALAAGLYMEDSIVIDEDISVIGAGSGATVIRSRGMEPTLMFTGSEGVFLGGVSLEGEGGLGLWLQAVVDITVDDLVVSGYRPAGEWDGRGVQVNACTGVEIHGLTAVDNSSHGVVFNESAGSMTGSWIHENGATDSPEEGAHGLFVLYGSVLGVGSPSAVSEDWAFAGDLDKGGCVLEENSGYGLLVVGSEVTARGLRLTGNRTGGLAALDCSTALDASLCPEETPVTFLEGSIVESPDPGLVGVATWEAPIILEHNRLIGSDEDDGDRGHCIEASVTEEGIPIRLADNELSECDGAAMIVTGPAHAEVTGNEIFDTGRWGGIWFYGTAEPSVVSFNIVEQPRGVGMVITQNSSAVVHGNTIFECQVEPVYSSKSKSFVNMAEGIVITEITDPAKHMAVHFSENVILQAAQTGLFLDDVGAWGVVIGDGNVMAGSDTGDLVLQNGAEDMLNSQPDLIEKILFSTETVEENPPEKLVLTPSLDDLLGFGICVPPECTEYPGGG